MRVLISNFRYLNLTGTETFTYTLLEALAKQKGFKIYFYSPFLGAKLLKRTRRLNLSISDNLNDFKKEKIDIIHSHHNLTSILLRCHFPKTPIVSLIHGCLEFLDQPPYFLKSNYYGSISEETGNYLKNFNIPKNKIFYFPNSVNCSRFKPKKPLPLWPKNLLVISNYIDRKAAKLIKKVSQQLNLKTWFIGKNKQKFNIEKEINKADIVMSLGRGIIEALSCGKAGLVFSYDHLHKTGDGMVTKDNIDVLAKKNFSGRAKKIPFNYKNLVKEFKKYNPQMSEFNRQYALKHFDINKNVKKLLKIYKQASQEKPGEYDKKQVDFITQAIKRVFDYQKLAFFYKDLRKPLFIRFRDQLISR